MTRKQAKAQGENVHTVIGTKSQQLQARMIELLPEHGWNIVKAGIAAGYSENYARNRLAKRVRENGELCTRIQRRKAEINATKGDRIDKLVRSWEKLAHDTSVSTRDRLKAGELLGKYHGIFSETRVLEVGHRQAELDTRDAQEARWLADARLKSLTGQTLEQQYRDGPKAVLSNVVQTGSKPAPTSEGIPCPLPPSVPAGADPVTPQAASDEPFPSSPCDISGNSNVDTEHLEQELVG